MSRFDINETYKILEKISPKMSLTLAAKALGLVSPFNGHLRAKLKEWGHLSTSFEVKNSRRVRNHLGGFHAGALFTLGESCPGFIIIKNFDFKTYRPILVNASIEYFKQVRSKAVGRAETTREKIDVVKTGLETGEPQFLEFETTITNEKNELASVCRTKWQIKRWDQVRSSNTDSKN